MAFSSYYLLVCLTSIVLWRHTSGGYTPLYTSSYVTRSNETGRGQVFPDFSSTLTSICSSVNIVSHFLSELNFDAVNNRILVGAADNLYLLNKDLSCASNYSWPTSPSALSNCLADNIGSDQNSTCRNHIRTYKAFPSDSSRLLVCGTQAGVTPECRTVTVASGSFGGDTQTVTASNGLVSYYPEFSGFGEFRRNGVSNDPTFFAAGFHRGTEGVGRDYNISYHTVEYNSGTSSLTLREEFSTKDSDYWLKHPVTFVDYYRADYTGFNTVATDYQFFFVFLRESLVGVSGYDVIYSRIVRICRNDGGINGQFSTYLKARIYCEREVPPGRDFNGAIDYQYNELQSMVFNDAGRFSESGIWVKTMYGAFTGPSIGPQGTAICAYRADNSIVTDGPSFGYNRGIFDIFRDDVVVTSRRNADGTFPEEENSFVQCAPSGRSAEDSEKVMIVQDVRQIGEDPLVVFDGFTVTQMAVDQVCVVNRNNSHECYNQDVLFLGTDNGKIMKVVFVIESGRELTPVIAEEITLDDQSEDNQVRELRIENESGEKFIYATTRSKIFRLPLQRCSRFNGQGCQKCLGSRDPYCVWNTMSGECEANSMTVDGSGLGAVNTNIWQNISTGAVTECQAAPACDLTASAIDHGTIMCMVECNNTVQVTFSSDISEATTRECNNNLISTSPSTTQTLEGGRACIQFTGGNGFNTYECKASISDSLLFTQRAMTPPGPPLQLFVDNITTEVTQTSFRVCVVVEDLTDDFYNYRLGVSYGSNNIQEAQSFTAGTCIWIRSQVPGSTINYSVQVNNSIGTTTSPMASLQLLDDIPGPCRDLRNNAISNVSVDLSWMAPEVTNGDITGYSVSVNSIEVIGCVSLMAPSYTVDGLQPFTSYLFGVRACTSAGAGDSVSIAYLTTCGRPGRVENLMLTPSSNSINAVWGRPTATFGDINNYEVNVVCDAIFTVRNNNTTYDRNGISPLTDCCLKVAAINTCNGIDHIGLSSEMCTTTLDVVPGAVQSITATSISSSSLLVEWSPPDNYQRPGLMYMVIISNNVANEIFNGAISTTYYFADQLNANTNYTISVQAMTASSSTPMSVRTINATTSPSVPLPPQNVNLEFREGNILDVSWVDSNQLIFNTSLYRVAWRCDNFSNEANTQSLSLPITLPPGALDFSWCTAKVQSINNIGTSEFSELTSIVIPPTRPQQPICYFVSDNGGSVTVNFGVTDPFLVDDLSYNWILYSSNASAAPVTNTSSAFNNINTIDIMVSRNTNYSFQLRLCNSVGCGDYCSSLVFFTGLNPPLPPTIINPSDINCCSVNVSWDLPPGEQEDSLNYTVQINGPCLSESIQVDPGESRSNRWDIVTGLCPGTKYTVVVQAIEPMFNIRGGFSQAFPLTTLPGAPSAPRSIVTRYTVTNTMDKNYFISVYWATPAIQNGVIVMYEVLWASFDAADKPNCNQLQDTRSVNVTNVTALEYTASNPTNIKSSAVKNIMVCVRAFTTREPGEWGSGTVNEEQFTLPSSSGLTDPMGGDCNNLIVVAVIAGLAVLSSVIVGIALAVVICKNGWTLCSKDKKKDLVGDVKHPQFTNRTNSMKPLMATQCNGNE